MITAKLQTTILIKMILTIWRLCIIVRRNTKVKMFGRKTRKTEMSHQCNANHFMQAPNPISL